jgi:hypothetical protein
MMTFNLQLKTCGLTRASSGDAPMIVLVFPCDRPMIPLEPRQDGHRGIIVCSTTCRAGSTQAQRATGTCFLPARSSACSFARLITYFLPSPDALSYFSSNPRWDNDARSAITVILLWFHCGSTILLCYSCIRLVQKVYECRIHQRDTNAHGRRAETMLQHKNCACPFLSSAAPFRYPDDGDQATHVQNVAVSGILPGFLPGHSGCSGILPGSVPVAFLFRPGARWYIR